MRPVTSKYPNHVWGCDLTTVPSASGFWVPWLPLALGATIKHVSRASHAEPSCSLPAEQVQQPVHPENSIRSVNRASFFGPIKQKQSSVLSGEFGRELDRRLVPVAPTGSGKEAIAGQIVMDSFARGLQVLVLAH